MWSRFVSLFKRDDTKSKLLAMCTSDHKPIELQQLKTLLAELNKSNKNNSFQKTLDWLLEAVEAKHNKQKPTKLKFVMLLIYALREKQYPQLDISNWVNTRKGPTREKQTSHLDFSKLQKSTILETSQQVHCLTSELADTLYFYVAKSIKSGIYQNNVDESIGLGTAASLENSFVQNVAKSYRMANILSCLCETKDVFEKIFSRYSSLGLVQQCFDWAREETNRLYCQFKESFEASCLSVSDPTIPELAELTEVSKKVYKQLKEIHGLSNMLIGEQVAVSRILLPKLAQPSLQLSRIIYTNSKKNISLGKSGLMKSRNFLGSSQLLAASPLKSQQNAANSANKQEPQQNFMNSLKQDKSEQEESQQRHSDYDQDG